MAPIYLSLRSGIHTKVRDIPCFRIDKVNPVWDTPCPMARPIKKLHSRTPLNRMVRIHKYLMDNSYPNCTSLSKEFEVSGKTIQRDLDYLRDQLEMPIDYDKTRHGYHYTEPVTHFPTISATEGEVLALLVAQRALQQYRGTPFEQPLASAFTKLANVLEGQVSVDLQELSQCLSFHHTGVALTDMETFRTVTRALREGRELRFGYRKLNSTRREQRRIQPYHVGSIDGQWYLFAHDVDRDDMRTFVLGRIQGNPLIGRKFKKDKDFSLSERLLGSFGVFSGEGNYKVAIAFDPFAAQLVRERSWHSTQSIEDHADGGATLRLDLDSLEEIEGWVLRWGGHATVIGPAALKKRVRASLKDMQDNYHESQPWLAELNEAARANQPDRLLQVVMTMDRQIEAPGQMTMRL